MRLTARGVLTRPLATRTIGRITTRSEPSDLERSEGIYFFRERALPDRLSGHLAGLTPDTLAEADGDVPVLHSVPELDYLTDGDVVVVGPEGFVRTLFRRNSAQNFLLVAERCNSYCLMCSQPPRTVDDVALMGEHYRTIDLIDPATTELGITGGEPTLLGRHFLQLIAYLKSHLSSTAIHVLTNGRRFSDGRFAAELGYVNHPDLMLGIPLYADVDAVHDYVVQARGAFDETILGLYHLAEAGVPIEIRVVMHRETYSRLPALAEFIARNLPFVRQVALMGLEVTGFARANFQALWIDPVDYQRELLDAVECLHLAGMRVSVYNHPLCVLDRRLWPFAVPSISDWKASFVEECSACGVRDRCGGLFATSSGRHSAHIAAIR